jgi:transmembrane sensor
MNTQHDMRLTEEAADWVLRRMEDDSPECSAAFLKWLKDSPHHIDEFMMTANTVAVLSGSQAAKRLDVQALLGEAPSNVMPLATSDRATITAPALTSAPARRSARSRGMQIAAGIAATTIGAWALWIYLAGDTFSTDIGEQRIVRLDDGSLVQLNTRSRVRIRFNEKSRELRLLDGEAYFIAAADTRRPFRVTVDDTPIQAVGTEFNVYRSPAGTVLTVLEGRVRVGDEDSKNALLDAGEQVSIASDGKAVRNAAPDVSTAVAWRQRRLIFRGVSLAEVAAQFNRYNEYQIRIVGDDLARQPIWGVFRVDEPQGLVKFLAGEPSMKLQEIRGGLVVRER